MHAEDVAHCDFKPDNVVIESLDANGKPEKVLITDFGLALRQGHLHELEVRSTFQVQLDSHLIDTTQRANERYRAPEIGLGDAKAMTLLVDSFAIAATVFFL